MNFREYLLKRQCDLNKKKDALKKRADDSTDIEEVKNISKQLQEILDELSDVNEKLANLANEDEPQDGEDKPQDDEPQDDERQLIGKRNYLAKYSTREAKNKDIYASREYREAFMRYVQKGEAIPQEFRGGANTNTLGATIPTTLIDEFINEIQVRYGNLYNKCRKLNIAGAVKFPIARLQAKFKWISESTVAPRDNAGSISDYVEFTYNTAEIRVSQSLLSNIVSIDLFEREIVNIMLIAYLQAMDNAIVNGTGDGQPLGILNDPRVLATGNVVELTEEEINDWTSWRKKFFSKLPLGYRNGEFIFPLSTVESYLETMADANNNPVFQQATGLQVNDGDAKNPNGRFFGREISLVEPDILQDFDTAKNGDVIGIFWQPEQYAINTNYDFGLRRWFDEDNNEWVNKMLVIVDGKVLNPYGIYLIKKKVTA